MTVSPSAVSLSDQAVLAAWEQGERAVPPDRALAVLRQVVPPSEAARLEEWTVGQRDALLLEVYVATFGDRVEATAHCLSCGEQLELALGVTAIRCPHGDAEARFAVPAEATDRQVTFRLPTGADLRAAAAAGGHPASRRVLEGRCIAVTDEQDRPVPVDELPAELLSAVAAEMARRDPQSDVQLEVRCDGCERAQTLRFDIADFLWRRLVAAAKQAVGDVHQLASAYGWPEADILALSATRRQHYLELVAG